MSTTESARHVTFARVHSLATAAGCQLVACGELAVAAESAGFTLPQLGRQPMFNRSMLSTPRRD
ncbi:hypothetical protein [Nocardia australiensis]|uniref:hypothetical protein n=1 Tax=Nocardia australiensis TaxID=2887191 RepID=UPI001D15421D|nr:hypothetical protein [Nocardia australiensis]